MAFIKMITKDGECYVIAHANTEFVSFNDVTIEEINSQPHIYETTINPNLLERRIEKSLGESLPSGIYTLRAEDIFDVTKLYTFTPAHDANLFELDVVEAVLKDFRSFIDNKPIYDKLGLSYKRGVLLYGPPGTGKTSAIQMIINKIRPKDSIVIYVTKTIPTDLIKELQKDDRLKIIVFEELCDIIDGRSKQRFLTFLDGENALGAMYSIATTNYPEALPGNIIERKGRFDELYEITPLNSKDRETYLSHLLERDVTEKELELTTGLPISSIKEIVLIMLKENKSMKDAVADIKRHSSLVKKSFKKTRDLGFSDDD